MTAPGVLVERGALASIALRRPGRFVVTDAHVARALEQLAPPAWRGAGGWRSLPHHVLPPGETSKSWEQLGALLESLEGAGIDRDGELLAIGGGVVTDVAGLAASLHRRGIAWIAAPTSLVGQVDAAHGGKTAINHAGGKNTVGTFHPPTAVVVDPATLATLPDRHLRAGFAEVLKTALVSGPALLDDALRLAPAQVRAADDAAVAVIAHCIDTKRQLVERDPLDHGARRVLNLGHTFGHAFETLAMPALLHGEAVGLGLLCAARLAAGRAAPLEALVRDALARWELPTTTELQAGAVLAAMRRDKKRRGAAAVHVLPRAPGRVEVVAIDDPEALEAALEAVHPGASAHS